MRMLASTAIPTDNIAAAIPLSVNVTDNNLNTDITNKQ